MGSLQLTHNSFFDYSPTSSTVSVDKTKAPTQITLGLWPINFGTRSGHLISASPEDTVEKFKENVANQLNVPFNQLAIYYCGNPLKDDGKNIGSYGFDMNTKLLAMLAMK